MQPTMCSRCKKNIAVVFITRVEGNETKNEGLCMKCARELGLKPLDDMMQKMGITDEELDNLNNEMMSAFGGAEGLESLFPQPVDGEEDDGRTATFPFLSQLFGGGPGSVPNADGGESKRNEKSSSGGKSEKATKRKFLENYCICLTKKAKEGKLDSLIGREREL